MNTKYFGNILKATSLVAMAVFLTACATKYSVRVDALSAPQWQPRTGMTYQWQSATDSVAEDDLFFMEVAGVLDKVMQEKGFRRVDDNVEPDMVVYVTAHLSDPMTESQTRSEPIYAERCGHSRVVSVPVVNSQGKVVSYVRQVYYSPPRTEMLGYYNRNEQVTVYDKVLRLSARQPSAEGMRAPEFWSLSVALRDRSTNYRGFMPFLATAALPYLGSRTDGEVVIEIPQDSETVQRFK